MYMSECIIKTSMWQLTDRYQSPVFAVEDNIFEIRMKSHPLRRNRIGTKAAELWGWQVEDIKKMMGPLAVQQYIQELIRNDSSAVQKIIECPPSIDINIWKYEQVRQFVLELNLLVTTLKDLCNKEICPTMKGSKEAEYLCAAHKTPMNCSAIDYMTHNLDQSTSVLLNFKSHGHRAPSASTATINEIKNLDTVVRRLYRLFLHTFHFHLQIFQEFERHMHLCERFTKFSLKNGLIEESAVTIPLTTFTNK